MTITPIMTTSAPLEAVTSEADRIASLVSGLPIATALFDRDLRYIVANSTWLAAFGISAKDPEGLRHVEVDPSCAAPLEELQQRALAGESVEHRGEANLAGHALRERVLRARAWRGPDNSIIGVVD